MNLSNKLKFLLALALSVCIFGIAESKPKKINDGDPIILTNYGYIKGVNDSLAYMFLGIPFANPPTNSLRWQPPVAIKPWSPQVLDGTQLKPACPQVNCSNNMPSDACPAATSEDCLYLNVFVPKSSTPNKAVMLFIHGGNFQYQGADSPLIDGRLYANYTDTIIVTVQYRLGALGFLVTGTEDGQIQGNLGIMDQRTAIKWIKANIAAFGGDPNRITLFGQSAGAQSTTIHLLSADMQSQFNNAILQSAPMSIPFRTYAEAMSICTFFEEALKCGVRDVACLMSKTVDEILDAQMAVETKISSLKLLDFFEPWLPWIDQKLVKGQLLEIEKWKLPNPIKPFISSTLTEECYIYIYKGFGKPINVQSYVELMVAGFKQHAVRIIENYPPNPSKSDQRDLTSVVATRWVFACSNRNFINQVVSKSKSKEIYYQTVFDFPLDFPGWENFTYCDTHVCHGSDIPYTFAATGPYNFTQVGLKLAQSHMYYWTNFAKFSNPNDQNKKTFDFWPSYSSNNTYLRFAGPKNLIQSSYLQAECDVFDKIGYYF